jgi:hypothetical protein
MNHPEVKLRCMARVDCLQSQENMPTVGHLSEGCNEVVTLWCCEIVTTIFLPGQGVVPKMTTCQSTTCTTRVTQPLASRVGRARDWNCGTCHRCAVGRAQDYTAACANKKQPSKRDRWNSVTNGLRTEPGAMLLNGFELNTIRRSAYSLPP